MELNDDDAHTDQLKIMTSGSTPRLYRQSSNSKAPKRDSAHLMPPSDNKKRPKRQESQYSPYLDPRYQRPTTRVQESQQIAPLQPMTAHEAELAQQYSRWLPASTPKAPTRFKNKRSIIFSPTGPGQIPTAVTRAPRGLDQVRSSGLCQTAGREKPHPLTNFTTFPSLHDTNNNFLNLERLTALSNWYAARLASPPPGLQGCGLSKSHLAHLTPPNLNLNASTQDPLSDFNTYPTRTLSPPSSLNSERSIDVTMSSLPFPQPSGPGSGQNQGPSSSNQYVPVQSQQMVVHGQAQSSTTDQSVPAQSQQMIIHGQAQAQTQALSMGPRPLGQVNNSKSTPPYRRGNILMTPAQMATENIHTLEAPLGVVSEIISGTFDLVANAYTPDSFIDLTKDWKPATFGVLKISYIPYNSTKNELLKYIGKEADLIENQIMGCPVHIIMERSTFKTMDSFVEFKTPEAAKEHYDRRWGVVDTDSEFRMGNRHVYVDISSQDELLATLFPLANCISWKNGQPELMPNTDPLSVGFQGIFTDEEFWCLTEYTERPYRSPFTQKALQRPFECMISILYKFPWQARKLYTVDKRNTVYKTYMRLLNVLVSRVFYQRYVSMDRKLYDDFIFAGINCPGFSERQKYNIMIESRLKDMVGRVSQFSEVWPFDTLSRKHTVDEYHTQVYLKCLETGWITLSDNQQASVIRKGYTVECHPMEFDGGSPWDVKHSLIFHTTDDDVGKAITFEQAAEYEIDLCRVLLQVGKQVLRMQMGMAYVNPLADGTLMATLERHFLPQLQIENASSDNIGHGALTPVAHGNQSSAVSMTPVDSLTENGSEDYSKRLSNASTVSSMTSAFDNFDLVPLNRPITSHRSSHSEPKIRTSRYAALFSELYPQYTGGSGHSSGQNTPRHNRMSSIGTTHDATTTPSMGHHKTSSLPVNTMPLAGGTQNFTSPRFGSGDQNTTPTRLGSGLVRAHRKANSLTMTTLTPPGDSQSSTPTRLGSGLVRNSYSASPSKSNHRGRLSIDATIHEEDEAESPPPLYSSFFKPSGSAQVLKITNTQRQQSNSGPGAK